MYVVFHPVDDECLVSLVGDDPGHIFPNILLPFLVKEVLPSSNRKDDLDVDL